MNTKFSVRNMRTLRFSNVVVWHTFRTDVFWLFQRGRNYEVRQHCFGGFRSVGYPCSSVSVVNVQFMMDVYAKDSVYHWNYKVVVWSQNERAFLNVFKTKTSKMAETNKMHLSLDRPQHYKTRARPYLKEGEPLLDVIKKTANVSWGSGYAWSRNWNTCTARQVKFHGSTQIPATPDACTSNFQIANNWDVAPSLPTVDQSLLKLPFKYLVVIRPPAETYGILKERSLLNLKLRGLGSNVPSALRPKGSVSCILRLLAFLPPNDSTNTNAMFSRRCWSNANNQEEG